MVTSAGISCAIPTDWTLGGGFYGNIYLNTGYPITNNGVLTNWCFRSGALGGAGDVKLKVFRPNGDNYDFVGESEFLTATNMFTVYSGSCNISVLEGDIIGYFVSAFTNAGSATQTMGTTTINHVGDIITSTPKSEWGSGYYTMSVYATDLAFEIQVGEYHNLTDNPPNISPQQTVFDISEYPTGDIYNTDDFATVIGEPLANSRSEIVAVNMILYGLDTFNETVNIKFLDPNSNIIHQIDWEVPAGNYLYYAIYSWIGKFPSEINVPGNYNIVITTPWFPPETIPFTITQSCPELEVALNLD